MRTATRWTASVLGLLAGLAVSGPAGAITTGAQPATIRAAASYRTVSGRLYHVAGTSGSNVWAVGLMPDSSLIEHWNGRSWSISFDQPIGYFLGVAARTRSDVWAVGGTNWFSPSQNLIMHWNGRSWRVVPSPSPSGGGYLTGVTATSATNAWAVGLIAPGGPGATGVYLPLIEHWNGRTWRVQRGPALPNGGQLRAVSATSATDAWAVGVTGSGSVTGALIEHWNGHQWSRVRSHAPGGIYLQGVRAISARNAWAVGFTDSTPIAQSVIMHWNGSRWQVQRSPNPTGNTNLQDVAASSPDSAWAVGYTNPNSCDPTCSAIIFHWNGRTWSVTNTPNPPAGYLNILLGVFAPAAGSAWAVGSTDFESTLIEHWNGNSWND